MRIRAAMLVAAMLVVAACGGSGSGLFRQYEYEEEMYLALDGSATVYVNSSVVALNGLRGTSFDMRPTARIDRATVRAYFSTPNTRVISVSTSRRSNRPFVHVRLAVDDVRKLADAAPFAWSSYGFGRDDALYIYRQSIGPGAGVSVGPVGWTGRETVAFRLHLPSKITYHNTRRDIGRGNILVWEQPLVDRLRGVPIELEARMETQSILYHTLWLFGTTMAAVAVTFALIVWWVLRRGPKPAEAR